MTRTLYDMLATLAIVLIWGLLTVLLLAGCTTATLHTTDCTATFERPVLADYVPGILGAESHTTDCQFRVEG